MDLKTTILSTCKITRFFDNTHISKKIRKFPKGLDNTIKECYNQLKFEYHKERL